MKTGLFYFIFSLTYNSIGIDGDLSDFDTTEVVFQDPNNDSHWGLHNELRRLCLTWDRYNLYIGIEYVVDQNALLCILFNGIFGIRNLNGLDWYPRNIQFSRLKASHLAALWNADLTTGGFRRILNPQRTQPIGNVQLANSGGPRNTSFLEIKIPFYEVFPDSVLRPLHLVVLISGGDHSNSGDAMPNNLNLSFGGISYIDQFFRISLDLDSNGVPDSGVSPRERVAIVKYEEEPLRILKFSPVKRVFRINESVKFFAVVSEDGDLILNVFNEFGEKVLEKYIDNVAGREEYEITFDASELGKSGIYIARLVFNNVVVEKRSFVILKN